jgi:two-component system, NtrC family, nitrogen regulation response regulator GlnG
MVNVTPITRTLSLSDSVALHLRDYFAAHKGELPPNGVYDRILAEVERPLIELCLDACNGNQIKAAELMGINRNTLRKKIRALSISVKRGRSEPLRQAA